MRQCITKPIIPMWTPDQNAYNVTHMLEVFWLHFCIKIGGSGHIIHCFLIRNDAAYLGVEMWKRVSRLYSELALSSATLEETVVLPCCTVGGQWIIYRSFFFHLSGLNTELFAIAVDNSSISHGVLHLSNGRGMDLHNKYKACWEAQMDLFGTMGCEY